jgi:hypothetical protein
LRDDPHQVKLPSQVRRKIVLAYRLNGRLCSNHGKQSTGYRCRLLASSRRNQPPSRTSALTLKAELELRRIGPACKSRHRTTACPSKAAVLYRHAVRLEMTLSRHWVGQRQYGSPRPMLLNLTLSIRCYYAPAHRRAFSILERCYEQSNCR